jgi:hypothetical protein
VAFLNDLWPLNVGVAKGVLNANCLAQAHTGVSNAKFAFSKSLSAKEDFDETSRFIAALLRASHSAARRFVARSSESMR